MRIAKRFKNILNRFLFWTGLPFLVGGLANQLLGYNFVYASIVSSVIIWIVNTELRIQDLNKKVFGRKKNGR